MSKAYLNYFSYCDWECGDDDKLRVGDRINLNHQRPYDGSERNFEGTIVRHHVNNLPVVLVEEDYLDLQNLMMEGWEFSRISSVEGSNK
jgi:hypothetical protein